MEEFLHDLQFSQKRIDVLLMMGPVPTEYATIDIDFTPKQLPLERTTSASR
jgi:hypothetical protein